jgi:hypothetical protein
VVVLWLETWSRNDTKHIFTHKKSSNEMPYDAEILRQSLVLAAVCVVGAAVVGPVLATVFDIAANVFLIGMFVSLAGYALLDTVRNRLSTG